MSQTKIPSCQLDIDLVKRTMAARAISCCLHYYEVLASTNDWAISLAKEGHPHGTLVVAEYQTSGRGRQGHGWHSPPGQGLYFSLLLRPGMPVGRMSGLTMALGVSVADQLERLFRLAVEVKWPNDLFCRGRKVGGILTEVDTTNGLAQAAVVGLGLNVNNPDFPPEISQTATSLSLEAGKGISREELLVDILSGWYRDYQDFLNRGLSAFERRLGDRLMLKGRKVRVECGNQNFCGTLAGCDPDGALLLIDRQGSVIICASGTLRESD